MSKRYLIEVTERETLGFGTRALISLIVGLFFATVFVFAGK